MRAPWLALAAIVCAACSAAPAPAGGAGVANAPSPGTGRAAKIRMEVPAAPDVADVPRLMVRDALIEDGYVVETPEFRDPTTTVQALLQDQLDVADLPFMQILAGIQRGAAISPIASRGGRVRVLVGTPGIKTCGQLDNQQVSVPNLNSTQTLTLRRYVDTRCPGTHVEFLVISRVENRMTGLLTHRTGGALLDLSSMLKVQRESENAYNVLSVFGVDFPELIEGTVAASHAFLERYPDTARDIIRELLTAIRKIQTPAALEHELVVRLGFSQEEAAVNAKLYLDNKVWDVNGGLAPESLQANIDFAAENGLIAPGMTTTQAADLTYLDAVLREIGRE